MISALAGGVRLLELLAHRNQIPVEPGVLLPLKQDQRDQAQRHKEKDCSHNLRVPFAPIYRPAAPRTISQVLRSGVLPLTAAGSSGMPLGPSWRILVLQPGVRGCENNL